MASNHDEFDQASAQAYRAAGVCVKKEVANTTEHLTDQDEIARVRGDLVISKLREWRGERDS
jgi:hypothetical protein